MRKVIFTESQLKHILNEDDLIGLTGAYNGDLDNEATPVDAEISVAGWLDNGELGDPIDTDEYFDDFSPKSQFGYRGGGLFESKKKRNLDESNQEMKANNISFKIGSNTRNTLANVKQNGCNSKMVNNMASEKSMKPDTGYKRIHDLLQLKKDNPQEYNRRGGDDLVKGLKATAKNNENLSKTRKSIKNKYNLNDGSDEKIEVGIKQQGKEHSKKDNTPKVTFTYEY